LVGLLVVLTAICAVPAAVSSVGAVDIVFGLPLALFLPGAALVWAIDPWGRRVTGPERLMWSFGASIGIVIFGGLILNLTGGLTRPHWLILTVVVVAVCAVLSWLQGGPRPTEAVDGPPADQEPTGRILGTLTLRAVVLLLAAVLVVSGALVLSQRTSTESNREHFVQAWLLPQPASNAFSTSAQLGVRNEEGGPEVIIIRLRAGSHGSTWTVGLKDGQSWTHQLSRSLGGTVTAKVALASDPSSVLARVDLAKPA
jgi:hypothetical protein